MSANITWFDQDSLPPNPLGYEWELNCIARGKTYLRVCGHGKGEISVRTLARGRIRPRIKLRGQGTIFPTLTGKGIGSNILTLKARGQGQIKLRARMIALGRIISDTHAGVQGAICNTSSRGRARTLNPIYESCDLNILLPYFTTFLPELGDIVPCPLPEQGRVKLHILDQIIRGQQFHGDTVVWTLMAVSFDNNPVMILRNLPNSTLPTRHITNEHNFKCMLGYLAILWDTRPVMTGALPGPITREHLTDLYRGRHAR